MHDVRVDTLQRLGRLDQGRFQRLGDRLLPHLFPDLVDLTANGINDSDRTIKGVPDSYVGPSPDTCTVAVEYNAWSGQLKTKLKSDYASVREHCDRAKVVVLVCSAPLDGIDIADLEEQARREGIDLRLIGGSTLSQILDEQRQDLRQSFLNIAIDSHTRHSLIARLTTVIGDQVRGGPWDLAQHNLIPRRDLDRATSARLSGDRPQLTIILGGIGAGKSIWSIALAQRLAEGSPTTWVRAKDLNFSVDDPLSAMIVHLAHGATSGERIIEIGYLLKRESLALNVVIDGVDEVPSYQALERAVRTFRSSALAATSHLLLVVREGAWSTLRPFLTAAWPSIETARETGILRLADLDSREAELWLVREGATAAEARLLSGLLPEEFHGRPLFLLRGLDLLRRGKLTRQAPFAHALVDDYLEKLALGESGPRPAVSRPSLRRRLGQLAWSCILAPSETISRNQLETADAVWQDDSEHGLLARCRRVGLLVERRPDVVGFAHSLYQAAFAADYMREATSTRWTESISDLPPSSRRARLVSLAPYLPSLDSLFDSLMGINVGLALECASQTPGALSPKHQALALDHLIALLESRFPSDRRAGLRLLAGMRGPDARALAVQRFDALSPGDKKIWAPEWAEVFLRLEEPGALEVIRHHWQLRSDVDFMWIEPDFSESLGRLSQRFREELADRAYQRVFDAASPDPPVEMMLAMLRDPRLVELFRARLKQGPLGYREHRLLVHLNTAEALDLFAESAQYWIDKMVALRGQPSEEVGAERNSALHTVVLKQTDITMHPHDKLLEIVDACLSSSLSETVFVGIEWAETLGHPALFLPWATSKATGWLMSGSGAIERAIRSGGAAVALPYMHRSAPRALRRALSWALRYCPGRATEDLLLEALNWDDIGEAAISSLGHLRVVRAVPGLCAMLATSEGWTLFSLIRVLGEIGHDGAVGPLVGWLRGLPPDRRIKHQETVCRSIAAIGGGQAVGELAKLLPGVAQEEHIIATLLARADAAGLDLALQRLRAHPMLLQSAIKVLGGMNMDRHLLQSSWGSDKVLRPYLHHPELCALLLEAVHQGLDHSMRWSTFDNPLRAAGRLDFPPALTWLRSIAEESMGWGDRDDQRRVDVPTCAREVLAEIGLEPYLSQAIDRSIDFTLDLSSISTHMLEQWPRSAVRARVVHRVVQTGATPHLAELLTRYAEPEDAQLLLKMEASEDLAVADIAHQLIRWEGFLHGDYGPGA